MSNAGQVALGIVGGAVGFVVGGPTGAAYGLQIGLAIGTVVSPTKLPGTFGPRLSDQRTTSAQMGTPIAEVFGVDVVAGQVIWLGDIVEHAMTEEVGGKGGPQSESTTFTYTQSIAIGLCRGPKLGVQRIWENGKLVYDVRPRQDDESIDVFTARIDAAAEYAEGFTLYLGDEDQLPDPTIELKEGVGNVPAFRGLMYIVYTDRELRADQGQRHPSFKFEIASAVIPNGRQAPAESLESSFILRAASLGLSDVGFQDGIGGEVFSNEIIGATAVCEIAGGYTSAIKAIAYYHTVAPPVNFVFLLAGRFQNMIKRVEYTGEFIVSPVIFESPPLESAAGPLGTYFGMNGTTETPFSAGSDYLVTVTSELPAGRLSRCFVFVEQVSRPFPYNYGILGYNRESLYGGTSGAGDFGNFEGTVDLGLASEIDVWGFFVTVIPGPGAELNVYLQGDRSGQALVITLTGAAGPVIFGPILPMSIVGIGAQTASRYFWECEDDMFLDGGIYEVTFRAVDVIPFVPVEEGSVPLSSIVETLCERCGLDDVDVSDLEEVRVHGYKIERLTDARSAIAVLRQVGFFDAVESTDGIKFVRRGAAPARTLTENDLGAHQYGSGEPPPLVTTKSTQDTELPRQLFVQYRDPARDYEDGQQASPTRLITEAVNDTTVDVSVAIDGTQALRAAEILWADIWAGRWQHSIALDGSHSDLEPTDVILVPVDGRLERMRIVSADDSALILRSLALVRDDDGTYVSSAIAEAPAAPPPVLSILSGSTLMLLDLPPLRSADNDPGIYAAAASDGAGTAWHGATIYRGLPGGTLSASASITNEAVIGTLSEALAAGPHTIFDDGSEVLVTLPRGQFESRPEADLLELGANTIAVGAHGRWELLQFGVATQVGPTSWELTHLLRGRRGTENNIGSALAGDSVVLVSGAGVVRLPLNIANVGEAFVYRAVSIGATISTGSDQTFTSAGEALKPFSPVHVTATDVAGDTLIEWTRRDRLAVEFTDPLPLSETVEAYEVDILSDSSPATVLRTLSSSTPSVTYTAAQRLDDFGSPGPSAILIRIYQLGQLGRGHYAEAML